NLASHFLHSRAFWEHHAWYENNFSISEEECPEIPSPILFKGKNDCICFGINIDRTVNNSFYIGADWLIENKQAVYVQSKINKDSDQQINYLAMLFQALKHPDVFEHTKDLF